MGGLVTTYGAGMAVPDWPNTFGYNLFLYPLESWLQVFDVLLEHSHRLIGAAVGLVAIGLAAALWVKDRRPTARALGVAAVVGVSIQGTLGGLRVIGDDLLLAKVHGCTAPLVFSLAAALVAYTSPAFRERPAPAVRPGARRLQRLSLAATALVYVQIVLGAQLRHLTPQESPGWFVLWVWLHLIAAGLLAAAVVWLLGLAGRRFADERSLVHGARWLAAALVAQLVLGAATWVTNYGWPAWFKELIWAIPYTVVAAGRLQALSTTAHVAVGSLALAAAVCLTLWSRRVAGGEGPGFRVQGSGFRGKPESRHRRSWWRNGVCPPPVTPSPRHPVTPSPRHAIASSIISCLRLVRPRIVGMVLATMTVSALVAGPEAPAAAELVHALVGTGLVIVGAIALNERAERQSDAKMARTAGRPLPSGRITAAQAGWFGVAASGVGMAYLGLLADWTLVGLAAVSWGLYVVLYTPLKVRSAWQTPLGALAGAMPTLMGAAAAGALWSVEGLTLFGVVYCWQLPHAMAIAWLYRGQFAAAGVQVASVIDPSGRTAGAIAMLGAGLLLPVSLVPWWAGMAGWGYSLAALALGLGYAGAAFAFCLRRDEPAARLLLRTSLAYLVGILLAMLLTQ